MARGKFEKPGSGKGGFVLLLVITILVIGGCIAGVLYLLNRDGPKESEDDTQLQTQVESTDPTDTLPELETADPTLAGEETTAETTEATEETTAPTEETTVPTVPETEATTPVGDATLGEKIAATARAQLGKPYQSGGNGPDAFDTTGFVYYCLKENQLLSKRLKLKELVTKGVEVAREDLQPGDVVFFWTENEGQAEYVGIYVGDGLFVAARNGEHPVSEMKMEYFQKTYVTARRFTVPS